MKPTRKQLEEIVRKELDLEYPNFVAIVENMIAAGVEVDPESKSIPDAWGELATLIYDKAVEIGPYSRERVAVAILRRVEKGKP